MTERRLDWASQHDPKSKKYSMRSLLKQKSIEIKPVMWEEGIVLDQGSEGACVGFAWTGELLSEPEAPVEQPSFSYANDLARSFYKQAQTVDQWSGENYEGTSVLAGAKTMKSLGFIGEYRWCFGLQDIRDALIAEGPVVIGIPWYEGMYETAQNGLVELKGKPVGGHALLLTGYHPKKRFGKQSHEVFRWRNSWGSDYGINGSGWIKAKDLEKLLKENAEACVPMQREVPLFNEPKRSIWRKLFNK